MWVQGVGDPYKADILPNLLPAGTTQGAIDTAKDLFIMAYEKCPDAVVVAGGYRYVIESVYYQKVGTKEESILVRELQS